MKRRVLTGALLLAALGLVAARPSLQDLQAQIDALSEPALLLNIYESQRAVSLVSHPTLPLTIPFDAFCGVGDQAIGGGFKLPVGTFDHNVAESHQGTEPRRWTTSIVVATGTITLDGTVYAYCLDLTP